MKKFTTIAALAVMSLSPAVLAEATLSQLEERLSNLELKNDLNLLQFGGRFITRYDNIHLTQNDRDSFNHNLYRLQFSLDMQANISSKLTFFGRYTTSKYFNHFNRGASTDAIVVGANPTESSNTRDLDIADNFEGGPTNYLERAYLNYNITDSLVASVGRLPTIDGSPSEFVDDSSRQGTYPLMAFSYVLDGVALTHNTQFEGGSTLSSRLVYTPTINYDGLDINMSQGGRSISLPAAVLSGAETTALGLGNNPGTYVFTLTGYQARQMKTAGSMLTGMMDYSKKGALGSKELSVIGQYSQIFDLYYPYSAISNLSIDYGIGTLMTQVNGVGGSNFDFSFSYSLTNVKSYGYVNRANLSIKSVASANATAAGTKCIDFAALGRGNTSAALNGTCQGFLTNKEKDSVTGHGFLLSSKYKFSSDMLKNPSLGFEAIYGTEEFFKFDGASHELSGFYSTRGWGGHLFWLQPITDGLKARIGYINKVNGFGSGTTAVLGAPVRNQDHIQNIYANLRLDF